jgi:hypothetical protein
VLFENSGTAAAFIVFNGQGVGIIDGSTGGSRCTTPAFGAGNGFNGSNTMGLVNVGASSGVNYLTVEGVTIRHCKTASASEVPAGVMIAGSGTVFNSSTTRS